jgi:hypothetical protein
VGSLKITRLQRYESRGPRGTSRRAEPSENPQDSRGQLDNFQPNCYFPYRYNVYWDAER